MTALPADISALMRSDKTLGATPKWDEKSDSRYFSILHPLIISGLTVGGLELRLKVSKQHAARDALMQIEYSQSGRRSATALVRIDWKPFHTHPSITGTLTGSHEHGFEDNYLSHENRMRSGSLPKATPLDPDPDTVSDFLALCGSKFRITDIAVIRIPARPGDLFWTKNG